MKNRLLKKFRWYVLATAVMGLAFIPLSFTDTNYFEISKNLDIFATLYKELNSYYVDNIEPGKLIRTGIDAMLESLDPYTQFISEADMEDYRLQTTGKYGGIGALIRKIGDWVVVAEPYQGFPAANAGLIAGDKILEIDGISVKGKNTDEVSKMLKGQAGTKVRVKFSRLVAGGTEKESEVMITREEIKIYNVQYAGMVNDAIGYIRLSNFTENAGNEVKEALEKLKQENPSMRALIFDLRGNPGGLLNEAVNVSNIFLPKGQEVVSTRGKVKEWDKTFRTNYPPVDATIPLAVLTNKGSASASEIVAGSIQDLDRGIIVGQKTFGKGLVQTTRPLTYNTKLKVTTAKYYIPSGRCIQAINYAERDSTGSVVRIPDSLKVAFKTVSGRTVYDGGGIDPDIPVEPMKLSNISIALLQNNLIFNYATIYHAEHDQIPPPREFSLTDKEYEKFMAYLADKDYDYTTKSEELLEKFEKSSQEEKYYEGIKEDFLKLKNSVMHDKQKDLIKHKEEIKDLLEEEIVSRYYHRVGRIEKSFESDPDLKAAIEALNDTVRYTALLRP
ncbi:MAG: peptidase S41 [Chitinophagales bacterium]|nr:MAG: peptidase S41 [Chitinophagales bacterium]